MSAVDLCIQQITELMQECEDLALLDLIYQLLDKSQKV